MEDKIKDSIMVTKSFLPPYEEYCDEIKDIWETHWLTNMGPKYEKFKIQIKEYLKCDYVSLLTNGHIALETALKTLDLKGEVITTPFTFASTTHAIVNCGLTPVFCDIKLDDYNIDESKIEELITEKTCAIVPVHVFGSPCNVKKIQEIANKYKLKVIYDSAHAFGVEINKIGIGNYGDISMFSLHATKVFNSIEGGVLTYNDSEIFKKIRLYKNFGISGPELIEEVGINGKMNEFQASMGLVNLKYLNLEINNRRKIFDEYKKNLCNIEGIKLLEEKKSIKYNYAYFPIIIDKERFGLDRDELYDKLKEKKIYSRKYFFPLITDFECYKKKYSDENLKNAKNIAENVLTLPMYGTLNIEIVKYICGIIKMESN